MSSRAFGKSLILAAAFATPVLSAPTQLAPRNNLSWVSPEYYWIFQYPLPIPPIKTTTTTWTNSSTGAVIDFYEVSIQSFEQQIYPNLPKTKLVGYDGMSPGPTFEMQKGIEAVARFSNLSPKETSVHVHGQYSRSPFDGWAADTSQPGQYKDYYYPNGQSARTLWYHDHAEFITAENVYEGLAGFYIINDSKEGSLRLPSGNYDIPLALSSKQYDNNGQLVFDTNDNNGLWGDIIHVNGQPWPYLHVEPRKYRLRLLDASVSRTYVLYFESDDGSDISFNVVASDGGFLSHPVETSTLNLAMGERYEIIFDFSSFSGKNVTLRNTQGVEQNIDYAATDKVMQFVVGNTVSSKENNGRLPSTLRAIPLPPEKTDADKDFEFARVGDEWKINGVGFADINARILTKPPRGAVEIWNLKNGAGGGVHPVHIHLIDFEILTRSGDNGSVLPYEAAGLKDVVYLGPGQSVQVIARYAPWDGVYMFHCHNLVHEDNDMLVGFNVTSLAKWGYPPSTHFINPMEPEFAPKAITASDFTQDAIEQKLAWFYSTNAYDHGEEDAVESALEAYWSTATDGGHAAATTAAATLTQTANSRFATPTGNKR